MDVYLLCDLPQHLLVNVLPTVYHNGHLRPRKTHSYNHHYPNLKAGYKTFLTLCILGNFSCFCLLLTFFLIIFFFKNLFQEHYWSVKWFGFRSRPMLTRSWSESELFAEVISRRQKLSLAWKELINPISVCIRNYLRYNVFKSFSKFYNIFDNSVDPDQLASDDLGQQCFL